MKNFQKTIQFLHSLELKKLTGQLVFCTHPNYLKGVICS